MIESMSTEDSRRYMRAMTFAVAERNVTLQLGEQFADWWSRSAWKFHNDMPSGFQHWAAQALPRAPDDEDE